MPTRTDSHLGSALYRLGFEAPFQDAGGRAFIRTVNWCTGFGKTHMAAAFAINLFRTEQVIPIFLAPLRSIVAGFADEVAGHLAQPRLAGDLSAAIHARAGEVPVYWLQPRDFHHYDREFFKEFLALEQWVHGEERILKALEANAEKAGQRSRRGGTLTGQLADARRRCHSCLTAEAPRPALDQESEKLEKEQYQRSAAVVMTMAQRIARKVIDMEVRSRGQESAISFTGHPAVKAMTQRLFPLQAFIDKPGIIICTATKAKMLQEVLVYDESRDQYSWRQFESIFEFARDLNTTGDPLACHLAPKRRRTRAALFVDEEESSYWALFEERKSVVNPRGRNDLSDVLSEFAKRFDVKLPLAFEYGGDRHLARKLFANFRYLADISNDLERQINRHRLDGGAGCIADEHLISAVRTQFSAKWPAAASQFSDAELYQLYSTLVTSGDVHNGFMRFRQKAAVLDKVKGFVCSLPRRAREDEYGTFKRLLELVFDKKFFTMSRSGYGELLDQPSQTFLDSSATVMTTDYLQRLELLPEAANHTIRIVYRPEGVKGGMFTLLDYVRFVVLVAEILSDTVGPARVTFSKDEQERYRTLWKFAGDVRALFKTRNQRGGLDGRTLADEPVGDDFFFRSVKSVISLDESERQADEYNTGQRIALSLTITSLSYTPEEDLRIALGESNGIYLISATGALQSASSGAFNQHYLRELVRDVNGIYFPMTEAELAVLQVEAERLGPLRKRTVRIVDESLVPHRFPSSTRFPWLLHQFDAALSSHGQSRDPRYSRFKQEEVAGLVCALDRLMTSPLRSGLCLSLSIKWARESLLVLSRSASFVRQVDAHGYHFTIDPLMLPRHSDNDGFDKLHVILYAAGRFKADISDGRAGAQGQFSQEFNDALDVTSSKVLIWSAYASAARGMNFITYRKGLEADFELVYLVNSPFYTHHTCIHARGFHIEMLQAMIQVLRDRPGNAAELTYSAILYRFARKRRMLLAHEHYIDLARTLLQALGRVERRPDGFIDAQEIYLDSLVARILQLGVLYAPELRQRASATQRVVLDSLDNYGRTTSFLPTALERSRYIARCRDLASQFEREMAALPRRFAASAPARLAWEKLFSPLMLTDPEAYLAHLETCNISPVIRNASYLILPDWATQYVAELPAPGATRYITDFQDGKDTYDWTLWVAPADLLHILPAPLNALHKYKQGFPSKRHEGCVLVPQPWFVIQILKGYIAEYVFLDLLKAELGLLPGQDIANGKFRLLDPVTHPLAEKIYQKFDFYIDINAQVIIAVDIKNWSPTTDRLQEGGLAKTARAKHRALARLFPHYAVHSLYVNLHGGYKHHVERQPDKGVILFLSMYVPSTLTRGKRWMINDNLVKALLGRTDFD